ncbi:hypothetical protein ACJ72_07564 [Emergomyces africanus]|uniref:NFACT RNA-binding domain-containing protein n=1 Tax=Emergomyces africanus TaxID=1955775 RepID=A0A1B7NNE8_9EURO|nr:hypothetical protein ACJ72_07564 [Emergomyces africanus]
MSTKRAIKSTEKKVAADLKQALKQEKPVIRPARTPFWFEKFMFFLSSDGYLVLGYVVILISCINYTCHTNSSNSGRDLQQTEILYRRHLKRGDVYVHADVQGAIPIFVKNKPGTPAGNLCVATSSAWDSKALMGAWWVNADQVSKTTPSGEYLATGGFVIRGDKNQLPPAQLLLGFAVMFQISEESVKNHTKHRVGDEVATLKGGIESKEEEGLLLCPDLKTLGEAEIEYINPHNEYDSSDEHNGKIEERRDEGHAEITEIYQQADESDSSDEENGEWEERREGKRANPLLNGEAKSDYSGSEEEEAKIEEEMTADDDLRDTREYNNTGAKVEKTSELEKNAISSQEEAGSKQQPDNITARPTKHLSARERRLLKKGIPVEQASGQRENSEPPSSTNIPSRTSTPSVAASTATTHIRGKRGKNKKLTTKYQHQDEEDRELALRLLGSAPKPDKLREAAQSKADRQAELEAQKQRRRAQHDRAAQAERERQMTLQQQQLGSQEGGGGGADGGDAQLDDADTAADISCLPSLVGTPVVSDEIIAAIPVCAPWLALGQYKYRAKLEPGNVKKGKAVKEILGKWVSDAAATVNAMEKGRGAWKKEPNTGDGEGEVVDENVNAEVKEEGNGPDRTRHDLKQLAVMELELIKGWRDVEVVNTLHVGKVKIVSGGAGKGDKGDKRKGGKAGGGGRKGGKAGKGKGGKK